VKDSEENQGFPPNLLSFTVSLRNLPFPNKCVGHNAGVKTIHARLDFQDIMWLRRAATKAGAAQIPPAIAEKLTSAGLIEYAAKPSTLKITDKGRIALTKLG
jgi:hypothetical protein